MENISFGNWTVIIQNPNEQEYEVVNDGSRMILLDSEHHYLIFLRLLNDNLFIENVDMNVSFCTILDKNELHLQLNED